MNYQEEIKKHRDMIIHHIKEHDRLKVSWILKEHPLRNFFKDPGPLVVDINKAGTKKIIVDDVFIAGDFPGGKRAWAAAGFILRKDGKPGKTRDLWMQDIETN